MNVRKERIELLKSCGPLSDKFPVKFKDGAELGRVSVACSCGAGHPDAVAYGQTSNWTDNSIDIEMALICEKCKTVTVQKTRFCSNGRFFEIRWNGEVSELRMRSKKRAAFHKWIGPGVGVFLGVLVFLIAQIYSES